MKSFKLIENRERVDVLKKLSYQLTHTSGPIIVTAHVRADGDSIGSSFALSEMLEHMGLEVFTLLESLPENYGFLRRPSKLFHRFEDIPSTPSLAVAVDSATEERICFDLEKFKDAYPHVTIINIDHHGDNSLYGDSNIVWSDASSTSEILFHLLNAFEITSTPSIAEALYTGIMTDCGRFAFSNTTSDVFLIASELVGLGVEPFMINRNIFERRTIGAIGLWGELFSRIKLYMNGMFALSYISMADFSRFNTSNDETEGMVNSLSWIDGVDLAVMIVEYPDCFRVNIRSRGDISSRDIAKIFGGGGHPQAAGCTMKAADLTSAIRIFVTVVEEYCERRLPIHR